MKRDEYIESVFIKDDPVLEEVLRTIEDRNMPMISVPNITGKFLTLLVQISGAKRALEIGALGGYSGICLCRGLPADGDLTSLELEQEYADLAQENLRKAGFGDKVTYYVGEALHSLQEIHEQGQKFDFFLIDADKGNYSNYMECALRLAAPGALIVGDNVLWQDKVLDPEHQDSDTVAIREFNQKMANDPRLESVLIPIADGLTIGRVIPDK